MSAVRSDNGKPLDGARGFYTLDGREFVRFELDAKGEARVQIPLKFRQLRLDLNKDGFVQYSVNLGDNPRGLPFTETYTAHMLPGTAIGGVVQDENGKPVEGVKVIFEAMYSLPDHPDKTCNGSGVAKTDAQGRWTFAGAPAEPQQMIMVAAQHPDFLLSSSHQNLGMSQFAQLKKKELVTVIRRGISVPGTVTDKDGRPIAKARIGQDSLGLVNGTVSDEQGKFVLRGVESGKRQMMASAEGYVAQEIDCAVSAGDVKPLEFKLLKGKEIRGRVVDGNGKPISGVSISFVPFKQYPRMNSYAITDADGQFVWNGAPDTPVTASLYKQGYMRLGNQTWTAGTDVKIAMAESASGDPFERPAVLTARGTVVDARTGRPVEKFLALVSVHKAERPTMTWTSHGEGNNGRYAVPVNEPGDGFVVRIDAEGYLPFESPSLTRTQVEQYSVKLTPGISLNGVVLQPDGKPAAGADVALREWFMLEVENGEIGMRRNTQQTHAAKADKDGRFQLPAREGRVRVFAVHPSGWGEWIVEGQGEAHEPLKMWNWSKVEGTVVEGGKPMAGKTVRIQVYGTAEDSSNRAEYSARGFFRYETTTDANGRFEFDRVIDGPGELQVEVGREGPLQRVENGYTAMLELKPGEHRVMNFGGSGRPVVGKLSIPDDLKGKVEMPHLGRMSRVQPTFVAPANYQDMTKEEKRELQDGFHRTPAYQDYLDKPTGYGVVVQPDGMFRANDVPAGQYLLSFSVLADRPDANNFIGMLASVTMPVTVPEMPGGRSDEPLDVNKLELEPRNPNGPKPLELKAYRNVKVGDNAPDFSALTLDGKPAKLADLRGKFVVADFWATWCGPCIADMPNTQKLHEKYKNDPKVVVLGISLDDRIDEPARFAKNRSLPWLQWYGGASGPQSAYTEFGIHGIPSVWIISPDGKVLARDLSGEAVAPALEKALKEE
ncbi:MAG TPA: carboxypeptidase regulatory-like domain-containing protein [Tepidisphaeraceae bacterium]|nr:carboxypeptidase regulatory-like domain-containing protein [Tepidisphaeraceae bacterium]